MFIIIIYINITDPKMFRFLRDHHQRLGHIHIIIIYINITDPKMFRFLRDHHQRLGHTHTHIYI